MDEKFLALAEANIQKAVEAKVATAASKAIPNTNLLPSEYVSEDCENCGIDLPEFRKQKGLIRCVPCQTIFEKKR